MKYKRIHIIHHGGSEVLSLVEDEIPEPKNYEVRIKILATDVSLAANISLIYSAYFTVGVLGLLLAKCLPSITHYFHLSLQQQYTIFQFQVLQHKFPLHILRNMADYWEKLRNMAKFDEYCTCPFTILYSRLSDTAFWNQKL